MNTRKFRKKPIVVEAIKWPCDNKTLFDFVGKSAVIRDTTLYIKTLEGEMTVSDGDWVIKGIQGEFYPCKPDIFYATYEKVA